MKNYKTPSEQVVKDHMWTKKFLSLLDDLITYFGILTFPPHFFLTYKIKFINEKETLLVWNNIIILCVQNKGLPKYEKGNRD